MTGEVQHSEWEWRYTHETGWEKRLITFGYWLAPEKDDLINLRNNSAQEKFKGK